MGLQPDSFRDQPIQIHIKKRTITIGKHTKIIAHFHCFKGLTISDSQ